MPTSFLRQAGSAGWSPAHGMDVVQVTHAGNAGYAAARGIHGAQHQASYRLGGATGAEIGGVLFDFLKHPDLAFCVIWKLEGNLGSGIFVQFAR